VSWHTPLESDGVPLTSQVANALALLEIVLMFMAVMLLNEVMVASAEFEVVVITITYDVVSLPIELVDVVLAGTEAKVLLVMDCDCIELVNEVVVMARRFEDDGALYDIIMLVLTLVLLDEAALEPVIAVTRKADWWPSELTMLVSCALK
jgi:hypothetical protein